jgi:hypothetical protein
MPGGVVTEAVVEGFVKDELAKLVKVPVDAEALVEDRPLVSLFRGSVIGGSSEAVEDGIGILSSVS